MQSFNNEQTHEVGMISALMFTEITPISFY